MLVAALFVLSALVAEPTQVVGRDGMLPIGRAMAPSGTLTVMNGRPVDIAAGPDGRMFLKDMSSIRIVDPRRPNDFVTLPVDGGASTHGLATTRDGRVLTTDAGSSLHIAAKRPAGRYAWIAKYELPGLAGKPSYPCGIALSPDEKLAYVALSMANQVAEVDLATGKILRRFETGVAPIDVILREGALFVANQGGPRPDEDDETAPSAGTEVEIDERGVAAKGSVSIIQLVGGTTREVEVGRQPTSLAQLPDGRIAVACTNEDEIWFLDANNGQIAQRLLLRPHEKFPYGAMPTGLTFDKNGQRLFVSLAGLNAIGIVDVGRGNKASVSGYVPTAWYPVATHFDGDFLWVVDNKGTGSRFEVRPEKEGHNSHDHSGALEKIALPRNFAESTKEVQRLSRMAHVLRQYERTGSADAKPVPVPSRLGDPSVFKHVIYVIKENRTYDQMFGDLGFGNGDPNLCIFKANATPNHRAIVKDFVLLDNAYCNGVLSADGHSWATEANVTPYLDRMFGGFTRSYTFGDDPLTYSSTGFLWDDVISSGLSFRNYGEFNYSELPKGKTFLDAIAAHRKGEKMAITHNIGVDRVKQFSNPDYPGWGMAIPDQYRVDRFLEDFREFEKNGDLPNLIVLYLPQDHTSGTASGFPTPDAHVADNDLALGRVVEALSRSRFWPETVFFINEDDPQAGFDHVDSHRSICLVASAYSRNRGVVSAMYNQTSVIATIRRILSLPPMNMNDAASNLMVDCFGAKPDLRPYKAIVPEVPLDQMNPSAENLSEEDARWARISAEIPDEWSGRRTDEHDRLLNRILWRAQKGPNAPYPAQFEPKRGVARD